LTARGQRKPSAIARLPFEAAELLSEGKAALKPLRRRFPVRLIETNLPLGAVEVQERPHQLVCLGHAMPLRRSLLGGLRPAEEEAVVGKVIAGEGEKVVDMPRFGSATGLFIKRQRAGQLAALRRHIAKLEEIGAEVARVFARVFNAPMGSC